MANEKSRNHEPAGKSKGGNGKAQGKPDSDKQGKAASKPASKPGSDSASKKPGPGKQPRDQLTVRKDAGPATQGK